MCVCVCAVMLCAWQGVVFNCVFVRLVCVCARVCGHACMCLVMVESVRAMFVCVRVVVCVCVCRETPPNCAEAVLITLSDQDESITGQV